MTYKFNEVRLERGMYAEKGKSFTQVLEALDPSEGYHGTAYEGLDAYQRQLKRFDIKVRGANSDAVEKFFATTEGSVLFPEYVSRVVRQGIEEQDTLSSLVATTTQIDCAGYKSIRAAADESSMCLDEVVDGSDIPATTMQMNSHYVKLKKRGRMLVASYEAIRFQRIDLFSVMLRQIGNQIMRMHLTDAIDVIRNGDGNDNAAPSYVVGDSTIGGTTGKLTYSELLAFWSTFDPYTMNTLLVSPDVILQLLKCTEFQNPLTGLSFAGTGEFFSPIGTRLIRTSALPTGTLIGLDGGYALEMVTAGGVDVEYDRLIDRQFERAAITSTVGFTKLYTDASGVLTV